MAKKIQVGIEIKGFDKIIKRFNDLDANIKPTVEKVLDETHKYVTDKAAQAMTKPNLPAGGRYSTGNTLDTLKVKSENEWSGYIASNETGFDIANGGLASIWLMYGTPKMNKVQGLYDAFYSNRTNAYIKKMQEDIFYGEIARLME